LKLKMETDDDVTILTVSESVELPHFAILKAGLKKLFSSEKKVILLDLNSAEPACLKKPEIVYEIVALPKWAQDCAAQVIVISSVSELGGTPTRDEALKTLKSPIGKLLSLETRLQAQLKILEQQKNEIVQKIGGKAGGPDPKALRRENSDLRRVITTLEENIQRYLAKRSNPHDSGAMKLRSETLKDLLLTILEQEGSLAVKMK